MNFSASNVVPTGNKDLGPNSVLQRILPPVGQRLDWLFSCMGGAFGPDGAVVLVLNLQNVGVQLNVFAITLGTNCFIGGVQGVNGHVEGGDEVLQLVETDAEIRLGVVVISHIAHTQRGRSRQ